MLKKGTAFLRILRTVLIWLIILGMLGGIAWFISFFVVLDRDVKDSEVLPDVLSASNGSQISSKAEWEQERIRILEAFENEVYGPMPKTHFTWNVTQRVLDTDRYAGADIELISMSAPDTALTLNVVLVIPESDKPLPLLVGSNFCPNHLRFPEYDIPEPALFPSMCGGGGMTSTLAHFIFGSLVDTFPFEEIAKREIAFASIYLAEGVPDNALAAPIALAELSKLSEKNVEGVIAAWAWEYLEVLKELEKDPRIDASRTALYGHSRDAKAALLAAASSDRVDLVIAHQSGKGGAPLWRSKTGESIEDLRKQYPHWFPAKLQTYRGREENFSVDQHHLLALVAPRPLLITGAQLDKWGDPVSAFNAARSASRVYELYGKTGITGSSLYAFEPSHYVAFFMRPWFHGVQPSDWSAFFTFLDAQF